MKNQLEICHESIREYIRFCFQSNLAPHTMEALDRYKEYREAI